TPITCNSSGKRLLHHSPNNAGISLRAVKSPEAPKIIRCNGVAMTAIPTDCVRIQHGERAMYHWPLYNGGCLLARTMKVRLQGVVPFAFCLGPRHSPFSAATDSTVHALASASDHPDCHLCGSRRWRVGVRSWVAA